MAHGVEAVLPLDIAEATYLLPPLNVPASTKDLIAHHTQQLQKRPEDLHEMSARVLRARKQLAAQFVKCFLSTIQEYDFEVGSLVLVHNSHIEKELNHKTKPFFLGPMVVVHCTKGGAYILAELNRAFSRLRYTAFQIIPYLASFLTVYLSPPCWMMWSWRMSSFIQKAFHLLMSYPTTTCSIHNLPHTTISSSLSIIIPFIRHTHQPINLGQPLNSFPLVPS